jgi:hypothetical protein
MGIDPEVHKLCVMCVIEVWGIGDNSMKKA